MKDLLNVLICAAVAYLLLSFISLNCDFTQWKESQRILLVGLIVVFMTFRKLDY